MIKNILFFLLIPTICFSIIQFENIKNRTISQFELTEIIVDFSNNDNNLSLLEKWKELSPKSFKDVDYTLAFLRAGDRSIKKGNTNQALTLYIKAYQQLDRKIVNKVEAAYKSALYLYAQKKRSEALFYINRSIEEMIKIKLQHKLIENIFYLKRRIVWRYFSRLEALPDNAISAVEFDQDDVWIGMWSGGVGRFSRSSSILEIFNPRNSKLPSFYVRDILVQDDKVWIATHCGLAYYNKAKATWHVINKLQNLKLKSITFDGQFYYVATLFKGIFRSKDGNNWENIIPKKNVLDLLNIKNEMYIATSEQGIYHYSDNSGLRKFLPDISAKVIIKDYNNKYLWIGTYGQGLLKVRRDDGKIIEHYTEKEIGSDYIESLLLVGNNLWIGTLEAGLNIYNFKSKKWKRIRLQDGLPGLDITTITRENKYLWFGTLAGGIGIYLFEEKYL